MPGHNLLFISVAYEQYHEKGVTHQIRGKLLIDMVFKVVLRSELPDRQPKIAACECRPARTGELPDRQPKTSVLDR